MAATGAQCERIALEDWGCSIPGHGSEWDNKSPGRSAREQDCADWSRAVRSQHHEERRVLGFLRRLTVKRSARRHSVLLRQRSEQLRAEFEQLADHWRRDTQHLSQISKKVAHPAYFRIMGMGEVAVPLLLEALRDRPAHWFAALQATANANPVIYGANPAQAREAWLQWGRSNNLLD